MKRIVAVMGLLALAATVRGEGQSLAELAEKEKQRREQNAAAGKKVRKATNVAAGSAAAEESGAGEFRFATTAEYETRLTEIYESLHPLCGEWKELAIACSGRSPQLFAAQCANPSDKDWELFSGETYRVHVVSDWPRACRERYAEIFSRFETIRDRYDVIYREYARFAEKDGALYRLRPRDIPLPR